VLTSQRCRLVVDLGEDRQREDRPPAEEAPPRPGPAPRSPYSAQALPSAVTPSKLIGMTETWLHEFNTGFTWEPPRGPFRYLTQQQALSYAADGYVVIPQVFDAAVIARMRAEIDPVQDRAAAAFRRLSPAHRPPFSITSRLVSHSDWLHQFCGAGVLPAIASDIVGPRVRLYWEQAVYKDPVVSGTFEWHQDNGKVFISPQHYVTCWIAMTDATEASGCLSVATGLHTRGTLRHWQSDRGWVCLDAVPAKCASVPMRAGDLAVFSSVTVHKTFPNRSGFTRKAYVVQYAPDGAVALRRAEDGSIRREPQVTPELQFLV
jgi:phytanoyl-CoA hydroxylase